MSAYKLMKDKGSSANVTLVNTDRHASVMIGRLDLNMIRILEKLEGLVFDREVAEATDIRSSWSLPIKEETAVELQKLAMKMSKPKRDQSKKATSEQQKPEGKPDALDIIFGLAK